MKKVSIYEYYSFGYNYNNLRYAMAGRRVHGNAEETCNNFLEMLDSLDLRVTQQAAEQFVTIREEMTRSGP